MSPILKRLSTAVLAAAVLKSPSRHSGAPAQIYVRLSEWKVELSQPSVTPGDVRFVITNAGQIPHAFEVEGAGMEKETAVIRPGDEDTLTLTLEAGRYEVYCPVGDDSHKKLGMDATLLVSNANARGGSSEYGASTPAARWIAVTGGGPVIQILPGPFPFADSAAATIAQFGAEQGMLEQQARNGPYSNNVAPINGSFSIRALDRDEVRDSIQGSAGFVTQDGARWTLLLDRVQTKGMPHHPRFGGVIMGLYYHGNTGVHTPLVPTINSAVALWAIGHLSRNGVRVTDNAMVHVMLLSRTRRSGDFALACWDCSRNPVDELQLQVTPAPGEPSFPVPGGVLFVNWEKSQSRVAS